MCETSTFANLLERKRSELFHMDKCEIGYNALFQEVFELTKYVRDNHFDVMEDTSYIKPNEYDVLLTDVNHRLIVGDVASRLDVKYLEPPTELDIEKMTVPINGILYGSNMRPMVNLVIYSKVKKLKRNVIFLIDTGSPHLYLSANALEALGFVDNLPETFSVVFNDMTFEASLSPIISSDGKVGRFKEINIIGSDFLRASRSSLIIDYKNAEVTMTFH